MFFRGNCSEKYEKLMQNISNTPANYIFLMKAGKVVVLHMWEKTLVYKKKPFMLIKTRKLTSWKCLWIVSPKNRLFQKNVSKNSLHWSWRSSNPFIALLCRKWLGKSFEEKIFGRGWEEFPYKSKFHIFLESLFQREGIVLIKMPQKLKREEQRGLLSVLPTNC